MKKTKAPKEKPVSKRKGFFRKKKSKREQSIDALLSGLEATAYAKPYNEEVLISDGSTPNDIKVVNTEVDFEKEYGVELLKPKNIIQRKSVYTKAIEASKYCDALSAYLTDNGLSVDKNSIREFFGSIAATKLIILKNDNPMITVRFIELFSEFIGAHYFGDSVQTNTEKFDDLFAKGNQFKDAILSAKNSVNRIHFMSFKKVESHNFNQYFERISNFALNPAMPCVIENEQCNSVKEMPSNMWFVIIPSNSEQFTLSEELAKSSVTIVISAKLVQPKDEVYQNELKLSYEYFSNLLLDAYNVYYLEEVDWKKIDAIEDYLKDDNSFKLDNRVFRQLERFTSTYLLFGGDKYEAMDSVLFSKFLPMISLLKLTSNQDSEEGIFQLFEKLFGLEYLGKSKKVLKNLQEANRPNSQL